MLKAWTVLRAVSVLLLVMRHLHIDIFMPSYQVRNPVLTDGGGVGVAFLKDIGSDLANVTVMEPHSCLLSSLCLISYLLFLLRSQSLLGGVCLSARLCFSRDPVIKSASCNMACSSMTAMTGGGAWWVKVASCVVMEESNYYVTIRLLAPALVFLVSVFDCWFCCRKSHSRPHGSMDDRNGEATNIRAADNMIWISKDIISMASHVVADPVPVVDITLLQRAG
ncbi:hypothetical protein EX30DRAFT_350524 [Ascodesmis nigricans]|uniref:Uncharacterized protein n=1 Tax=Ascodesmis nigricans TaxID=341454 RepID=A0A4S2MPL4_9PEZI|nr:hypothetical protein EX30DRAFT_350524 [Ascodesmis nigricans]